MSPCYDAQEADYNRQCRKRLDKVTRLLCELLTSLDEYAPEQPLLSSELEDWWDEHKAADREREKRND